MQVEIKIVRTFTHPLHADKTDQPDLFFSENLQFMLEVLDENRIRLYYWEDEWVLVKRLQFFDRALQGSASTISHFSPDFTKFVCFDFKRGVLIIRDSVTEQIVYEVPKWIIKPKEGIKKVMNRFLWLDNERILFAHKEGMEVVYRVGDWT